MIPQDQVQRARQADLVQYLMAQGHDLRSEGIQYRLPDHGGLLVERNHWYCHSTYQGGNTLDYLVQIEGMSFPAAVEALTGIRPTPPAHPRPAKEDTSKEFALPERAEDDHRVFAYLTQTRGIPGPLIAEVVRTGLLYQDVHGNCIFPTRDDAGTARGAIIRGTCTYGEPFKGRAPGSDMEFGWHWPPSYGRRSSDLVIVEAPIDAMSLAAMSAAPNLYDSHVLALGGLHQEAVNSFLDRHPEVTRVSLYLDNDGPGRTAAAELRLALGARGQVPTEHYPASKDWNEELFRRQATATSSRYYTPRQPAPDQDRER
ncbi:MAG: DUF3991 and TOPRIM domain-containing protein [Peptococcaceae bacterium]|jgi:hypothetical protein|nr:DUF3991 and TOPRIM domain-containing protein [Peptococcaceae bacterium]